MSAQKSLTHVWSPSTVWSHLTRPSYVPLLWTESVEVSNLLELMVILEPEWFTSIYGESRPVGSVAMATENSLLELHTLTQVTCSYALFNQTHCRILFDFYPSQLPHSYDFLQGNLQTGHSSWGCLHKRALPMSGALQQFGVTWQDLAMYLCCGQSQSTYLS